MTQLIVCLQIQNGGTPELASTGILPGPDSVGYPYSNQSIMSESVLPLVSRWTHSVSTSTPRRLVVEMHVFPFFSSDWILGTRVLRVKSLVTNP